MFGHFKVSCSFGFEKNRKTTSEYKPKMGLQDCQILLDNPWNTYYAGQTVNGQVKLTLNSPKKIRGMCRMNF